MNKSDLLQWFREEQSKWELLILAIGERRMNLSGVNGEWTMKDIIVHLTGWERWLAIRLKAAHAGDADPMPPWHGEVTAEDEINAWIYASGRDKSIQQVLTEARQAYLQTQAVVEELPDDIRIETIGTRFHVICIGDDMFAIGEMFHHFYDDHQKDVYEWLKRTE